MMATPYRGTFLARVPRRAGRTDTNLLVQRDRRGGNGLREDVAIRNYAGEPAGCTVTVAVDADFADLFEVKEGRVQVRGERRVQWQGERLVLDQRWRDNHRGAVVVAPGGVLAAASYGAPGVGSIRFDVVVPARGQWTTSILVQPVVDGEE